MPPLDPLARVKRAAAAKRAAEQEYRGALVAAVEHFEQLGTKTRGQSDAYARTAQAAGVTRQSVRELVNRSRESNEVMEARLAEIDAKWERFVDAIAPMFQHPDAQREQLYRNSVNARIRRAHAGVTRSGKTSSGVSPVRGMRVLPTVAGEARTVAEATALKLLEDRAGDPFIDSVVAELDEAERLRQSLTARRDSKVSFLHD